MPWCLIVVDGADLERVFPLPLTGKILVGKDRANGHISFNDFYLERAHCTLQIAEEGVMVYDTSQERGIFVNGKKVVKHAHLYLGDVLRVGNTFLRLDTFYGDPPEAPPEDERPTLPTLSFKRLGDLQGHMLGRFELSRLLGKGQHGVVFHARDLDANKTIALKVLAPDFPANSDELKQFARVIKTLAAVGEHPSLVRWTGTGKVGPYIWISEELVEGENLSGIFNHPEVTRFSWKAAWRLAWDLGQALEHLYQHHAAHGNITSANILVTEDGRMKLNDARFSAAIEGSVWQQERKAAKQTAELPFLPPERLEEGAFVDEHVADIYGLGVATYQRLTCGQLPFQGNTPEETMAAIRTGVTDKLRRRAPNAPEGFLEVIYKMLARRQEDRYQTPAQLLEALEPLNEKR